MFEIIHRYTKAVLYKSEIATSARQAVEEASRSGANLTGADLTGANLTGADLTGANLTGADLTRANLTRANLTRANLTGADLTRANLTRANLTRANLTGADLTRANLTRANLTRADLTRANLTRANLTDLRAKLLPDAPDAKALRSAVADQIEAHPELHDQETWGEGTADPACGTPCCVAGWACQLGGGKRNLTVPTAAALLLHLDGAPMPDFDAATSREDILRDLRAVPE